VTTEKISFLVSGFLPEYEDKIMRVLISGSYSECSVFCGVSEALLIRLGKASESYFPSLTASIKDWLRQGQAEVESRASPSSPAAVAAAGAAAPVTAGKRVSIAKVTISFSPLLVSPLGDSGFFVPSCAGFFPALGDDAPTGKDHTELSLSSQRHVDLASAALAEMLGQRNWHSYFFSLGPTAELVGRRLSEVYQQPAQPGSHASVLLIDRTLDLVGPCLHTDHLLDQMFSTVPRKTAFSIDLSINLDPLLHPGSDQAMLLPDISGTLSTAGTTSEELQRLQRALLEEHSRGALTAVKKALVDIATKEKLAMKAPKGLGKVTLPQLCEMMEAFSSSSPAFSKHLPILQLVSAVIQTLKTREADKWEELMGVEKMLMATLTEGESVLQQLCELIQGDDGGPRFTLNQILILGVLVYSLLGEEDFAATEGAAEAAFREAVQRVLSRADGSEEITLAAREKTEHIFAKLQGVHKGRAGLATYKSLVDREGESPYVPLVRRVVEDLFDEAKGDIPDIVQAHPPENVQQKGFLSSFSQYLVKGKARPDARAVLVVFVIGGITCNEIKDVLEVVSRNKNEQILIGGTDIITPKEVYSSVFL